MTLESVSPKYMVGIDRDQCVSCGLCIKSCFHGVYKRESGSILVDSGKCTACLRCVVMCPKAVITVKAKSEFKNWILSIKKLVLSKAKRWKKDRSRHRRNR